MVIYGARIQWLYICLSIINGMNCHAEELGCAGEHCHWCIARRFKHAGIFCENIPLQCQKKTLNINNKENIEIIFWAVFFNDKLN